MATRRPNRAVQIVAGLAAFGLLAGLLVGIFVGVGGDTTTTSTTTTSTTTTAPLSTEQYVQRVAETSQRLAEAAGERCALAIAYTDVQALPAPADAEQMRELIGVTVEFLRAAAISAVGDQPGVSEQIAATADELAAEAEAAGFDPGFVQDAGDETALADPAFTDAFTQYQESTFETCFEEDGTPRSTAEPGG